MVDNPGHDDLYDAFLDALLAGEVVEPEGFMQEAGVESADLLIKLKGLQEASQILPTTSAASFNESAEGLPFPRLGEYRLLTRLGGGGMGTVYLAEQESLGRKVAIKVIRPELIGSQNASQRFQQEARSLARIQHPNVVTVFGFGIESGAHYLAMEFIPGLDLTETLQDAQDAEIDLPPAEAVRWTLEIARALQCVHDEGLMHRDVKASNIRVTPEGRAVLVDFGLASEPDVDGPTMTRSFVGSPATASPEQILGAKDLDPRTDVYSLGVTLYRCITGTQPFSGKSMEALFHQVLNSEPISPRRLRPGIPRDLETVILHAMEKDANRRYQTATAFANDLEAVLEFRPIQARPPVLARRLHQWVRRHRASAAALITASIAMLAGIAFLVFQAQKKERAIHADAVGLLATARETMDGFIQLGKEIRSQKFHVVRLQTSFESTFVAPGDIRELDQLVNAYQADELRRERLFSQALEFLEQAERTDPEIQGANAIRAELFILRYQEAVEVNDNAASRFYRGRAHQFDDGTIWNKLLAPAVLHLDVTPPGPVQIFPFRYVEHNLVAADGDPRMIPVPGFNGEELPPPGSLPIAPGTWCLKVIEAQRPAQLGDLIVNIAGFEIQNSILVLRGNSSPEPSGAPKILRLDRLLSVDETPLLDAYDIDQLALTPAKIRNWKFEREGQPFEVTCSFTDLGIALGIPMDLAHQGNCTAQVLRNGKLLEIAVPQGIQVRTTASPRILLDEFSTTISGPKQTMAIEPGLQAFVIRRSGFEDCLVQINTKPDGEIFVPVNLVATQTTPPGFNRISIQPTWDLPSYWIMDREVTSVEYLTFLNSPEILAEISASLTPIRFPRHFRNESSGGSWINNPDGSYSLPQGWESDWPSFEISWHDAVRFAEWKTAKARAAGLPHTYRLPTRVEFNRASLGGSTWGYPYGMDFRPNWSNCCFSRRKPAPEPVLRYPIDASPFDVYDCSGGALEWLNEWWDQDQTQRFAAGGSWAQGGATAAKPMAGLGVLPSSTSSEVSFRLVLEFDDWKNVGDQKR